MRVALVGEALIDFTGCGPLAFQGHVGGGTLNTAVGCARLGLATGFITQVSTDLFGERLLRFMVEAGIDTRFILRGEAPTTLAFVERSEATNRYAFYLAGSSTTQWAPDELPDLPQACRFLLFGSISVLLEPACTRITDFVAGQQDRRIVVFDPNVRPSVIADMDAYRHRFWRWLASTHILKLSDEDVVAVSPGFTLETAAAAYLAAGPAVVFVTRGAQGATLYRRGQPSIAVPALAIQLVDSIGAGDTFTAGVVAALDDLGLEDPGGLAQLTDAQWHGVMTFATAAAALNCTRAGAQPPQRSEVAALLQANRQQQTFRPS